MLKLRIDLLVARSVDAPIVRDIERLQAFRFIRQVHDVHGEGVALQLTCFCSFKVVSVCPMKMPQSLVSPLVSIVLSDTEPADTLTWSSLASLSEIGIFSVVSLLLLSWNIFSGCESKGILSVWCSSGFAKGYFEVSGTVWYG